MGDASSRAGSGGKTAIAYVRSIADVRASIAVARRQPDAVVGLVPTMGAFHEGHLSLMRAARSRCSFVAVSVFVNPIQFGGTDDFNTYPRDLDRDLAMAAGAGADLLFAPPDGEMYPPGFETAVEPGSIATGLCGASRPGHFRGVATVVAKLLNIFAPDIAFFGQKDAQQAAVIRRMATDLNFDVEVSVEPIVREGDGLAMSSRNTYLEPDERTQAVALFEALSQARDAVAAGETSVARLRRRMKRKIAEHYLVDLEYVKVVDPATMEPVSAVEGPVLAAVAARVGRTRLIDNMLLLPAGGD